MAVVGSPSYFAERKRPKTPQDLTSHNCLNLRLPTHGGSLYAWEFEKDGRELNVRVEGQLVFNSAGLLLEGALKGLGLAYLTEGHVQPYISKANLSAFFPTGVPHSPATIFTILAGVSLRPRSRSWSTRFDTRGGDSR